MVLMAFCDTRKQVEGLLDLIPRMYAETPCSEVALGAVVKALLSGLVSPSVVVPANDLS